MSADKSKIEQLAYRIWEAEGCPEGRDFDHWLQAEAQANGAKQAPPKAAKPKAAKVEKPKAAKVEKPKAAPKAKTAPKAKSAAVPAKV